MSTETEQGTQLHGGRLVAKRLKAHGVSKLFTLSGGHLFSIYDGCRDEGIDIVDVRHEQSAAFAAEGWAKATREPGVAALTAGPGVTNGMSGMASALQNGSPMLVLGGRAPALRWGQGSLQEIDHVPFVAPVTKLARTAEATAEIPGLIDEALHAAATSRRPGRPSSTSRSTRSSWSRTWTPTRPASLPDPLTRAGGRRRRARARGRAAARGERPVIMAGTGLYWAHGEDALVRALRGAVGAGVPERPGARLRAGRPPMFFSRARGTGLKGADVALVVGVPMDFRLGFGGSFGEDTQIVVIGSAPPERPHPREVGGRAVRRRGRRRWTRCARAAAGGRRAQRLGGRAARGREREARRRAGRAQRRARAAAPDARSTTSCSRCSTATRS